MLNGSGIGHSRGVSYRLIPESAQLSGQHGRQASRLRHGVGSASLSLQQAQHAQRWLHQSSNRFSQACWYRVCTAGPFIMGSSGSPGFNSRRACCVRDCTGRRDALPHMH